MIHQETTWYFLVHFLPNWIYTTVTIAEKVQTNQILTYPSPINVKDRSESFLSSQAIKRS